MLACKCAWRASSLIWIKRCARKGVGRGAPGSQVLHQKQPAFHDLPTVHDTTLCAQPERCLLLAQSRHHGSRPGCPLPRVKQTSPGGRDMAVFDPKPNLRESRGFGEG